MSTLAESPPCVRDALGLLHRQGKQPSKIVSVEIDSILYLDKDRRPMTACLWCAPSGSLHVLTEPGFQAERGVAFTGEDAGLV